MNMQVNGTYDVIVLLVPLPITTVLALLPEKISSESRLLPCPRVKEGEHLVVFELGRQFGTGPGFIGSNFQEAKLEIPFIRHPELPADSTAPFVYKHTVFMDSTALSWASRMIAGIRTQKASFDPPTSPEGFDETAPQMLYTVPDKIEATLMKCPEVDEEEFKLAKGIMTAPFFAEGTGRKFQRFDYDFKEPHITPYRVTGNISFHLPSFMMTTTPAAIELLSSPALGEDKWLAIDGVFGYRGKLSATMSGSMDVKLASDVPEM